MKTLLYENRYGYLEIETVEDYRKASTITSKEIDSNLFFDNEDATRIALITDNRNIQLACTYNNRMFLVHHSEPSLAAVCRIVRLETYTKDDNFSFDNSCYDNFKW